MVNESEDEKYKEDDVVKEPSKVIACTHAEIETMEDENEPYMQTLQEWKRFADERRKGLAILTMDFLAD
jgi:hypothetical protein